MNKRNRIGTDNPNFQNGKTLHNGYWSFSSKIWGANVGRYEHRVVMEDVLGRPLLSTEIVHHKDGNKTNNNPDNLEIVTRPEHAHIHSTGKMLRCKNCGAEHWYSPSLMVTLQTHGEQYYCRKCSCTALYHKNCKRCGNPFDAKRTAQFCVACGGKPRHVKKQK